ncbi:hypothetical protein LINPERHAP1_LOCUS18239, partial [Linum perenne]
PSLHLGDSELGLKITGERSFARVILIRFYSFYLFFLFMMNSVSIFDSVVMNMSS